MPKQKTDVVRILPAGMPTSRQENIYVNFFPEVVENSLSGTKRVYCVKRKGLSETYCDASASATGEARGVFYWAALDRTYFIYGDTLWEYDGATLTNRKTLATSTGTVGFIEAAYGIKKYMFFCDGTDGYLIDKDTPTVVTTIDNTIVEETVITNVGSGYANGTYALGFTGGGGSGAAGTYTIAGGALSSILITNKGSGYTSAPTLSFPSGGGSNAAALAFLSSFPVPHIPTPIFIDGYLLLAKGNTSEVYNSLLGDFGAFRSGQFVSVTQFAGNITGLTKQQNYLICFKEDSVEYLYNAGNTTGSPLSRSTQAITAFGCNQRNTIQSLEDDIIFVGKGSGGGFGVWKINGFKEVKVSTEYVDTYLNDDLELYGNTSLSADYLSGAVVRLDGHSFYLVGERVNTKNKRHLVFDPQEKFWSFWDSAVLGASEFIGKYATTRFDKSYFQTPSKKILRFPQDAAAGSYNDNAAVYTASYSSPYVDMDNQNRKRWRSLDLIGDHYSYDNEVYIKYKDTGSLVSPGWKINLGMSKARIWQIYHDTDKPLRFENIELFYVQGVS
jgi:hypothetical protein